MTHGYVLFYDDENHVLVQRKSYFQHFSVQRDCYYTQPICANPGQITLPGGSLNSEIIAREGTLAASLKQFVEESGVMLEFLGELHYSDRGCYSDLEDPHAIHCEDIFYVHFVRVDSVDQTAIEANRILDVVIGILNDSSLSESERNKKLRDLHQSTGFNDDAADGYLSVPREDLLPLLSDTIPFEVSLKHMWKNMVRDQALFKERQRERKIRNILTDPGDGRDWLVAASTEYQNVVRGCLIMGEDGLGFDGGFCLFGPASPGDEIRINKSVLTKEMTAFLFSSCIGDMWDLCYVINCLDMSWLHIQQQVVGN